MAKQENALLGKVVAKFGSIRKFANACGISYPRAYRIVTGGQTKTENDLRLLIQTLDLHDAEEIVSLFSLS